MYKKILLPIDLQHTVESKKALDVAIDEARRSNGTITVITVAPGFGMPLVASFFDSGALQKALKEVGRHLQEYLSGNIPDDVSSAAVLVEGNPAELILKQAEIDQSDLIVISSHNNQLEHIVLGSCAAKIVRHAKCTVTVVK